MICLLRPTDLWGRCRTCAARTIGAFLDCVPIERNERSLMVRNFYLRKQADAVAGSANFASMIETDFADYGLTSAQSVTFQGLNTALQDSYTTAMEPMTRTPVAIEAKDEALKDMRDNAILLARIIYATSTVTDAQLVALGLLPRPVPAPRPATTTAPVVEVMLVNGRLVKVRIRAVDADGSRKPIGSAGAQVYSFVGPAAPTDPRQYHYEGLATRGTCEIQFPNDVASGATAWIAAGWVSQRGTPGIACTPVQVTIQGGPILAAAA